jgi:hypothetical protein
MQEKHHLKEILISNRLQEMPCNGNNYFSFITYLHPTTQ